MRNVLLHVVLSSVSSHGTHSKLANCKHWLMARDQENGSFGNNGILLKLVTYAPLQLVSRALKCSRNLCQASILCVT